MSKQPRKQFTLLKKRLSAPIREAANLAEKEAISSSHVEQKVERVASESS